VLWEIPDGTRERVRDAVVMDAVVQDTHLCALALRAGRGEVCSGAGCPLWEDDGCALVRLSADGELYGDEWLEEALVE
jgi:hypothetical protein